MRIAVVGGTGTAGRAAVTESRSRGHDVRIIGRHRPDPAVTGAEFATADLSTGEGLDTALHDVDAVIDCSNLATQNGGAAMEFFVGGTRRLLAAEARAGVHRHVLLSIVGIDQVSLPYYRAKLAQEAAARTSQDAEMRAADPIGVTVVRATQFHDFPGQLLDLMARSPVALIPSLPVQPVATGDVAAALVDAVEAPEPARLVEIGGPRQERLVDLARRVLQARGRRPLVLPVPLPGRAAGAVRRGALMLPRGRVGTVTFDQWLATASQP